MPGVGLALFGPTPPQATGTMATVACKPTDLTAPIGGAD
jgi:hypothetical protein